jgi:hypothetical protein
VKPLTTHPALKPPLKIREVSGGKRPVYETTYWEAWPVSKDLEVGDAAGWPTDKVELWNKYLPASAFLLSDSKYYQLSKDIVAHDWFGSMPAGLYVKGGKPLTKHTSGWIRYEAEALYVDGVSLGELAHLKKMEFDITATTGAGKLHSFSITDTPEREKDNEQPLVTLLNTKKTAVYTKPIAHSLYIEWDDFLPHDGSFTHQFWVRPEFKEATR